MEKSLSSYSHGFSSCKDKRDVVEKSKKYNHVSLSERKRESEKERKRKRGGYL